MKRVAILFLVATVFALAPAAANAQGLFGSGLPSFGGLWGGSSTCGDKCEGLAAGTTLYIGWMNDPNAVNATFTAEQTPLFAITEARQRYTLQGVWLGLGQSIPLGDRLAVVASGWYLIPSDVHSSEGYFNPQLLNGVPEKWSTKNQWWFVDGLLALGAGGNVQILAGVRYDSFTTKFSDRSIFPLGGLPGDTADVKSQGIIPLVGVQYAQAGGNSNLVFRVVGIPTLVGSIRYREDLGGNSFEGSGNYSGGYFIEAFAEYGYKMGGLGNIGFFGRYNATNGKSVLNFDLIPGGTSADYRLGLNRYSWTLGGEFSLNFAVPYM